LARLTLRHTSLAPFTPTIPEDGGGVARANKAGGMVWPDRWPWPIDPHHPRPRVWNLHRKRYKIDAK